MYTIFLWTVDIDLVLKIYIKARATPKFVAAFTERREFDKILIYFKQVGYIYFDFLTFSNMISLIRIPVYFKAFRRLVTFCCPFVCLMFYTIVVINGTLKLLNLVNVFK